MLTLNVPSFIQAPENRRQKSMSYFPYIMYNMKKIWTYRDVQYGKNMLLVVQYGKNNVRSGLGCLKWVFLVGLKLKLYNKYFYDSVHIGRWTDGRTDGRYYYIPSPLSRGDNKNINLSVCPSHFLVYAIT